MIFKLGKMWRAWKDHKMYEKKLDDKTCKSWKLEEKKLSDKCANL